MASYNELIALINAYIKQNGIQAITGQILNGVLRAMVDQIGRGYAIMGTAVPADDPGTPDAPESWFASTPGTYTNFGGFEVADAEFALLSYTPSTGWAKTTLTEGITEITAGIDNNVGTPYVEATYQNGALEFQFYNLKGATGDPAGFGTVNATVDANIGTPSVSVSGSGPDTAKNYTFAFHNLKGETGVTSVVATVDNTTGNPSCAVSLVGQELHLDFTGLKGAQGDTGSSVDYPFTIVNNLTTNDATQALSAAMGVELASQVSQLEAKVGDLTTLVTPEKTSVVGAINSIFTPVVSNIIDINNLSQRWKDADISWSVANDVLNIVNGNTSANKGIEFYLPANDPSKTYTLTMNCDSDRVLNIFAYLGNYNNRVAIAKNENTYSGNFNGASSLWVLITLKSSGNVNFSDVSLTEDGAVAEPIIKNDLIKELPLSSLEESTQGKISGSAQLDLLKTDFSIPAGADYYATELIVGWSENAIRIKNIHSANSGVSIAVPAIVGASYKVVFVADSTGFIFGVTSASNTTLASTKTGVVGNNESAEFVVPSGFGLVNINISVYSGRTINFTGCFLVRSDISFLPVEKYSDIPAKAIRRRYDVPCNKVYYCETGENIDFFTNGLIDSDTPDGDFTLRMSQPNFYAQEGALGPGFATRFRLKVDATNPSPSKNVAYVYDRFGYASAFWLYFIKTGAPVNPGTAKNVLMIGDSLTARLYLPCYFRKFLNEAGLSNWNMVGRVNTTAHPEIATDVRFEANGGYAWPNYVDDPATLPAQFPNNYFWDAQAGHISIQYYMDTYCGGVSPDIVLCNIGWNQFVNGNYSSMTMEEMKVKVKTFLDTLHSEYPNCKAVLTGIQRGRANSKDCNHRFYLDSQMKLARAYQDISEDENYRGWVIYGNIAPYFDGSIGLQTEQRSISMFTDATEEYVLEEVHPNEMGYKIFAFALYLHFLYLANH